MKGNLYRHGALGAVALVLAAAVPAQADDERRPVNVGPVNLARVQVFSGGIDLAPTVRYEKAILTISGVDTTFRREFDSYSRPSIDVFGPDGNVLTDGVYAWELQLVPDGATAKRLQASAMNNGGKAEREWLPQTGTFAVLGGAIATPDVRESGAAARRASRASEAPRAGSRREVASRQVAGQVFGEKALGSRGHAVDTDEAVGAGQGQERGLLKGAADSAPRALTPRREAITQDRGPDSDHQAIQQGISMEKAQALVNASPLATEKKKRTTSAEGSNGRPRDNR